MLLDKPYIEIFNEKLKSYNFIYMLSEPTYGEEVVKSELSQGAYELITEWQRDIYFNKKFLKDYFQLREMPIYEKVVDFFQYMVEELSAMKVLRYLITPYKLVRDIQFKVFQCE